MSAVLVGAAWQRCRVHFLRNLLAQVPKGSPRRSPPRCGPFSLSRKRRYCSVEYATALKTHDMVGSMGRTGICWDNTLAESFFASLRKNLFIVRHSRPPRHARKAIAEYIEVFYNRQRLHSAIGHRTPAQAETDCQTLQIPAAA